MEILQIWEVRIWVAAEFYDLKAGLLWRNGASVKEPGRLEQGRDKNVYRGGPQLEGGLLLTRFDIFRHQNQTLCCEYSLVVLQRVLVAHGVSEKLD
jgi:hypothetical protein